MKFNIPYKIRASIYICYSIGSIVVTYLVAKRIFGVDEATAWTALGVFVAGLAGINTSPTTSAK